MAFFNETTHVSYYFTCRITYDLRARRLYPSPAHARRPSLVVCVLCAVPFYFSFPLSPSSRFFCILPRTLERSRPASVLAAGRLIVLGAGCWRSRLSNQLWLHYHCCLCSCQPTCRGPHTCASLHMCCWRVHVCARWQTLVHRGPHRFENILRWCACVKLRACVWPLQSSNHSPLARAAAVFV